jgi:hypothetical protein
MLRYDTSYDIFLDMFRQNYFEDFSTSTRFDCFGREHGRHHGQRRGFRRGGPGFMGDFAGSDFPGGRKLDAIDIQLVILALLAEHPAHGYELIKTLEERSGGFYTPSPGVIYPALTYLHEIGHANSRERESCTALQPKVKRISRPIVRMPRRFSVRWRALAGAWNRCARHLPAWVIPTEALPMKCIGRVMR